MFVVDAERRLVGVLPFKDLVVSRPDRRVRDFMAPADVSVRPDADQEEVARLLARYNLPSVAVVDEVGRLLGRITFDDVIDVVEAESTEDLLQFGGVSGGRGARGGVAGGGAEPAAVALPQPAHGVSRRRGGLRLPGHRAAHGGARGVDADHRGDGRERGHPGARGHRAPARAGADPDPPVRRAWSGKEVLVGMVNGLAIGVVVGLVAAI